MYSAKIIADSVCPAGVRLTTFEVVFPRVVLAEFNTHRMFSRNSASSRAIPVAKAVKRVRENPYIPTFALNKPGMQPGAELPTFSQRLARGLWIVVMYTCTTAALALNRLGVHKQWANRLIEPFSWHTVLVTATDWDNFFALRTHPDAQQEIRTIALLMQEQYHAATPKRLPAGQWHLPLVDLERDKDIAEEDLTLVSAGRCARVSYLTHDGVRDPQADLRLARTLLQSGHMSPFEHQARALSFDVRIGNFRGWSQYRKSLANEACFRPNTRKVSQ